ncbi:MAG: hypothetical protein IJC54_02505 [Clostridia bacterium]|nr:hypothetical protein [Clostridia bacterium]
METGDMAENVQNGTFTMPVGNVIVKAVVMPKAAAMPALIDTPTAAPTAALSAAPLCRTELLHAARREPLHNNSAVAHRVFA